jgi:predicted PhzF superfamily epimerase YddE/YHI9
MARFPDEATVRALRPDFARFLSRGVRNIMVTAPGDECDFVSRYFGPGSGIPEDPVTGSAHCTLAPYWAQRLGREELRARQVSERGGELWCRLAGDRVHIAGHAVTVMRGELELPA